jgi:hypothetical protein
MFFCISQVNAKWQKFWNIKTGTKQKHASATIKQDTKGLSAVGSKVVPKPAQ